MKIYWKVSEIARDHDVSVPEIRYIISKHEIPVIKKRKVIKVNFESYALIHKEVLKKKFKKKTNENK